MKDKEIGAGARGWGENAETPKRRNQKSKSKKVNKSKAEGLLVRESLLAPAIARVLREKGRAGNAAAARPEARVAARGVAPLRVRGVVIGAYTMIVQAFTIVVEG